MNDETERQIRERAYALWEADGRPEGTPDEYWYRARREVADAEEPRSGSLDDQLADTFPASDPLSATEPSQSTRALPAAPEDEAFPARSATLEEPPAKPAPKAPKAAAPKPAGKKPAAAKPASPAKPAAPRKAPAGKGA